MSNQRKLREIRGGRFQRIRRRLDPQEVKTIMAATYGSHAQTMFLKYFRREHDLR